LIYDDTSQSERLDSTFKNYMMPHLTPVTIKQSKNVYELLYALMDKGLIRIGYYSLLIEIFETSKRQVLADSILKLEIIMQDLLMKIRIMDPNVSTYNFEH